MKMGPEGNIWVNFPITTFQQSLTHSALEDMVVLASRGVLVCLMFNV